MSTICLDDLCTDAPPLGPADWNDDGVEYLPGFIPDDLIDAYKACWQAEHGTPVYVAEDRVPIAWAKADGSRGDAKGWAHATPYMEHRELRDLLCWQPLSDRLHVLVGEAMGVHLNLTGWLTTERDWHADQYLNEPGVDDFYAAVWIALEDIDEDSGPFQYVPGSHRWPQVSRELLWEAMGPEKVADPQWPKYSEEILTPMFEAEIWRRQAEVVTFVPKRGDVLVWHGRLLHRGSRANLPGLARPALIAHFSGVETRSKIDMPDYSRHDGQGHFFILGGNVPV